jgi:hypothetical protein
VANGLEAPVLVGNVGDMIGGCGPFRKLLGSVDGNTAIGISDCFITGGEVELAVKNGAPVRGPNSVDDCIAAGTAVFGDCCHMAIVPPIPTMSAAAPMRADFVIADADIAACSVDAGRIASGWCKTGRKPQTR